MHIYRNYIYIYVCIYIYIYIYIYKWNKEIIDPSVWSVFSSYGPTLLLNFALLWELYIPQVDPKWIPISSLSSALKGKLGHGFSPSLYPFLKWMYFHKSPTSRSLYFIICNFLNAAMFKFCNNMLHIIHVSILTWFPSF